MTNAKSVPNITFYNLVCQALKETIFVFFIKKLPKRDSRDILLS